MHDLQKLIAEWRKNMMAAPEVTDEILDELENHLRENVAQLVRTGMTESEAFHQATTQLGGAATLATEFRKLDQRPWLPLKLVLGVGAVVTLAMLVLLSGRFVAGRTTFLLASHVFSVTIGYTATFLIGALGVCFVGQRCFSEFSPLRKQTLIRASFVLGFVAASTTLIGVVLGMVWAKTNLGRYWAWDALETGAFAVMMWQLFFLFAHSFARRSARGILVLSILGNIIVGLGWFGANLLRGLHSYGILSWPLLLLAIATNLAIFLIGCAPAGWLRPRRLS